MTIETKEVVLGAVATAAAVVTGSAAVSAADVAADDWSGLYVGGSLNYDSGDTTYYDRDYGDESTGVGAFIGFNHQMDSVVVGAEVAYNKMALVDYTSYNYAIDSAVDLKAKVGYDLNGFALIYGFVGGSVTTGTGYDAYGYNDFGYNFGAGIAMKVGDSMSVGLEYINRQSQHSYEMDGYEGVEYNTQSVALRAAYHF